MAPGQSQQGQEGRLQRLRPPPPAGHQSQKRRPRPRPSPTKRARSLRTREPVSPGANGTHDHLCRKRGNVAQVCRVNVGGRATSSCVRRNVSRGAGRDLSCDQLPHVQVPERMVTVLSWLRQKLHRSLLLALFFEHSRRSRSWSTRTGHCALAAPRPRPWKGAHQRHERRPTPQTARW